MMCGHSQEKWMQTEHWVRSSHPDIDQGIHREKFVNTNDNQREPKYYIINMYFYFRGHRLQSYMMFPCSLTPTTIWFTIFQMEK